MIKNNFSCCYGCYAYGRGPGATCLVGETQNWVKSKYGEMAYASRYNCKVKNTKELVKRMEEELERMRIK